MVKRRREPKNVAALIQDLASPATFVRRMAIIDLAGRASRESLRHLMALAGDKEATIRACVAWALGEMGDASAAPTLAGLLKDLDVEVRRAAATSLEGMHAPQALDALNRALTDSDKWVADHAARALARQSSRSRLRPRKVAPAPVMHPFDDAPFELKP